jgi:hypothetical protein
MTVLDKLLRDESSLGRAARHIKAQFPDFNVKVKQESVLMRVLGKLMFWNSGFMSRQITTIGNTMYFPQNTIDRWFYLENEKAMAAYKKAYCETFAHEYVHMLDGRSRWFKLGYLFPQILGVLALGSLGAFWCVYALGCLLFLAALAPWPSPGRTKAEARAYTISLRLSKRRLFSIKRAFIEWRHYYKMSWSPEQEIRKIQRDVKRGTGPLREPAIVAMLKVCLDSRKG